MRGDGGVRSGTSSGENRSVAFDGLRGVACVLVVLLHLWIIVPVSYLDGDGAFPGPLLGLFKSGNLAVDLFLILGSFLVTSSLLQRHERTGAYDVPRFWMRRVVRLGSQLYLLVLVMFVVSRLDRWDSWTDEQTNRTLSGISTFTFNWVLVDDVQGTREDLGHLWYLSVEQQFYLVWVFVLAWLGRFRLLLVATLAGTVTLLFVTRFAAVDENPFTAGLRTDTRADGLLLGALAALLLPYLRRFVDVARRLVVPCALSLLVIVLYTPELDGYAFLETQGIVFAVIATLLVLSLALAQRPDGPTERLLSVPALVLLGRMSFPIYLWHYPVFWASGRWAHGFGWLPRAIGAVIVLAGVVAVTHHLVERPILRWLDGRQREPASTPQVAAA